MRLSDDAVTLLRNGLEILQPETHHEQCLRDTMLSMLLDHELERKTR